MLSLLFHFFNLIFINDKFYKLKLIGSLNINSINQIFIHPNNHFKLPQVNTENIFQDNRLMTVK